MLKKQAEVLLQALTVLEYLLLWGSNKVIRYCQDNLYEIKTLREFQYIDDNAVDCGMNVRQKAKDITNLVLNPSLLESRRRRNGHDYDDSRSRLQDADDFPRSRHSPPGRARRSPENDEDVKRAMAESRRLAEQQRRTTTEEDDLQRALKLSKEEEEKRLRAIANSNSTLFNDLADKWVHSFDTKAIELTCLRITRPKEDTLIDLSDIQFNPSPALQVQYTQYQSVMQPQFTIQPQYTQIQPQYTLFQASYTYQNDEALQVSKVIAVVDGVSDL